ncbi:tetracycline resistance protein, class B [Janthinobacterium sp. HH104]|uniref:Predicted arabinose efflux permease, MFS family n=2 Tax=Janthinobacterium lividum TaxID=29581 RepID=A0AB38CAC5_9BURK|nr:tetracycline resistance protein, class B [Janthinobacterium sp. HH104]SFX82457.1 Predicted arabinose efflux permease, MFS family [Janthinobacterium lividum]
MVTYACQTNIRRTRMKNIILISAACLLALLSTIGASLPYPILPPLFAAEAPNAFNNFLGLPSKLLFGLALTINPLGLLIGSALLGPLSDRYGRRPLLMRTAVGAAIGHAITAWALVIQSYPLFIVARFITGLLEGNGAVARAMLADQLTGPLRLRAMSWLNGAFYLGWLVGPILAGATLHWGVTVPFWIAAAALMLVAVLVAVGLQRETPSLLTTSWWQVARDRHSLNLLRHEELRTLFIVQLAFTCGVASFYEFYPLWLVETANYHAQEIAWVNVGLCGTMTITSLLAGGPSRHAPLLRACWYACGVALAVGILALGNIWVGIAAIVLFGIPNALYNTVIQGWCAERFSAHGQGAVMGLLATTFCIANIVVALSGSVLTLIDTRLILVAGALSAAWAAWRMVAWRRQLDGAVEAKACQDFCS